MTDEEFLATQVAAEYLAKELTDKSTEQWALWLRNNRNSSRPAVYRVPTRQIGRGAFYRPNDLASFIEFEKKRRLGTVKLSAKAAEALEAFGIGEPGSTAQGRRWVGASANLITDASGVSVQTIINEPLMVFKMTPEQALELGRELIEVAQAAQDINRPQQPNFEKYEQVLNTAQALVMRRKSK